MTPRKKKGIGFAISGGVFLLVGGLFYFVEATPAWLAIVVQLVGVIAGALGFTVVFPDTEI